MIEFRMRTESLQVITGFMATAYITLILVIVHYLFDHDQTKNPVDRVIIDSVAKLWKYLISDRDKPALKWSEAIEFAVLMFSDQQLITGIGILVSGYTQINCGLSAYHWQIVVYLAWFSSLTHLTTLTALRTFFREQPTLAYWRVFFMGCTVVLLATALGSTGYIYQDYLSTPLAVPAFCLFSTTDNQEAQQLNALQPFDIPYVSLSLLFLAASYISRVITLFTSTDTAALRGLRTRPGYALKKCILATMKQSTSSERSLSRMSWAMLSLVLMTFYILLKVIFEIGQSMFWEVRFAFYLTLKSS